MPSLAAFLIISSFDISPEAASEEASEEASADEASDAELSAAADELLSVAVDDVLLFEQAVSADAVHHTVKIAASNLLFFIVFRPFSIKTVRVCLSFYLKPLSCTAVFQHN